MKKIDEEKICDALDCIKDVVRENESLRADNERMKRFLAALCMCSETGSVSMVSPMMYDVDIDEMLSNCVLEISENYDHCFFVNDIVEPSLCYIKVPSYGSNYLKCNQSDLINLFNKHKYQV